MWKQPLDQQSDIVLKQRTRDCQCTSIVHSFLFWPLSCGIPWNRFECFWFFFVPVKSSKILVRLICKSTLQLSVEFRKFCNFPQEQECGRLSHSWSCLRIINTHAQCSSAKHMAVKQVSSMGKQSSCGV